MVSQGFSDWRIRAQQSPEIVDRILIGLCTLIWLVWLGMSVAAVVALIDLGRGFRQPTHNPHTGLLYIVIGISALVILTAIPMLLRARRVAPARPAMRLDFRDHRGAAAPARTGQRTTGSIGPNTAQVDRVLLRGIVELAGAIGTALAVVALATYLMAVGKDTAAWVGYGVAGLVTVLMPTVPWRYVRQLPR